MDRVPPACSLRSFPKAGYPLSGELVGRAGTSSHLLPRLWEPHKAQVGASRSTSWAGRTLLPEPGVGVEGGALSLPPSSNRLPSAPFCQLRLLTRCACPAAPGCPVCYTARTWSCSSSVPASGGAWDTGYIFLLRSSALGVGGH